MDKDKSFSFDSSGEKKDSDQVQDTAPRARNRTVMLTPEITGQMRARLAQDIEPGAGTQGHQPPSEFSSAHAHAPASGEGSGPDNGFVSTLSRSRSFSHDTQERPRAAALPSPASAPTSVENKTPGVIWAKKSPVVGFLVSFDVNVNGDIYELRSGRVIVTSEASGLGNFFIINDETVSPMHAILRISANGEVQVLDQLSEHGTKIKRFGSEDETELSGEKGSLEHGDVVSFGKRQFHVCIIQSAVKE